MTAKPQIPLAEHNRRLSAGTVAFCLMSALTFFLLLLCAENAIAAMRDALTLCARTVIPSLFPFMVASELIVHSGVATALGRLCTPVCKKLFGLRGEASAPLLLGMLCGFPIGAKSAASLYENGRISRAELCHLLCFCNQPSSAFVISAVGISLFGSRRFGLLLYGTTLVSGLVIGLACRFLIPKDDTPPAARTERIRETSVGVARFTDAITGAAHGMLSICAFVCFFATLVGCLSAIPAIAHAPDALRALTFGFFELTGGVSRATACRSVMTAALVAAWCVGWSGLSVHFQIMSLCHRCEVSFRPYFAAKAAQGALNVLLLATIMRGWQPSADALLEVPQRTPSNDRSAWTVWVACLALCLLIEYLRWGKKREFCGKKRQNSR